MIVSRSSNSKGNCILVVVVIMSQSSNSKGNCILYKSISVSLQNSYGSQVGSVDVNTYFN